MNKRRSLAAVANEAVPFRTAALWAGVDAGGRAKCHCPLELGHDDGGAEASLRVYEDHGYCFACQRYFSVVSLLAAVWEVDPEDAAAEALRRSGYKPAGYAHLFARAACAPEVDPDALACALRYWCEAHCPDWPQRQYETRTAARLARCLGLLHLVRSEEDCATWLEAAKKAMIPFLSSPKSPGTLSDES